MEYISIPLASLRMGDSLDRISLSVRRVLVLKWGKRKTPLTLRCGSFQTPQRHASKNGIHRGVEDSLGGTLSVLPWHLISWGNKLISTREEWITFLFTTR